MSDDPAREWRKYFKATKLPLVKWQLENGKFTGGMRDEAVRWIASRERIKWSVVIGSAVALVGLGFTVAEFFRQDTRPAAAIPTPNPVEATPPT